MKTDFRPSQSPPSKDRPTTTVDGTAHHHGSAIVVDFWNKFLTSRRRTRRDRGCCLSRCCSAATLLYYIVAVVLIQNALMAYSFLLRRQPSSSSSRADSLTTALNAVHADLPAVSAAMRRLNPMSSSSSSSSKNSSNNAIELHRNEAQGMQTVQKPMTEDEFYRRRKNKAFPFIYDAVLRPNFVVCRPETLIVILVHSHPSNVNQRAAIRETWGEAVRTGAWPDDARNGSSCRRLQMAFVLGIDRRATSNRAVVDEQGRHGDILQGNFIDDYRNMTLKSLLGLKFVDETCGKRFAEAANSNYYYFLLKTDDDMIVNLPYLIDLLTNSTWTRSIVGPLNVGAKVYRQGKWSVSVAEFPFGVYPPYESGSAYVITGDLVHELRTTAEYVPPIFVDDVYITGILGRILDVNHVRQKGFAFWSDKAPTACDILTRRVITGTKMKPDLLRITWRILQLGPVCRY